MAQITYEWLFTYLVRLGFEDTSQSEFDRVFEHSGRGALLAFSMLDDPSENRPVRDADIVSAEYRLQQEGMLAGSLLDLPAQVGEL